MNKLKQWLIEEIETHLNDYEDTEIYACDVAYKIFESENANGSYTCSTYEAKEWIKQYWDDIGEITEEIKSEYGTADFIPNIFDEPEKFQVIIVLEGANFILGQSDFISKHWNDKITLTKANIKKILKGIKNEHDEFYK